MAGAFHQDAAHRLGRGGKEVSTAVPGMLLARLTPRAHHESEIRLVHQRGRLERLTRGFLRDLVSRQPAQFVVDERQ